MKQTFRNTALLAVVTVSIIAMPNGAAAYMGAPSGTYLNLATNQVVFYDNGTGTVTTIGMSAFPDVCPSPGSTSAKMQCGHCGYAPNGEGSWKSQVTQYTYGRCASVDVSDPLAPMLRADVRILRQGATDWFVNASVEYMRIGQSTPVVAPSTLFNRDCDDNVVSYCQGVPTEPPGLAGSAVLLGANYYCLKVRVYDSRVVNAAPVVEAAGCTGILN